MKCYEKLTGKCYESSYDIIAEANKRFRKTVENKLIGTIDEYFFWIMYTFNCNHAYTMYKDLDRTYTMCKNIYGDAIGTIKFDSAMDENDNTPTLIIDFILQ